MARLSQLTIYPIKSTSGIHLESAQVETQGLAFDRRFLIADSSGAMITGRASPELLRITSALNHNGLTLHYPNKPSLDLVYSAFDMRNAHSQVWSDQFQSYTTIDTANTWISEILKAPAQLLYCGEQSRRVGGEIQTPLSFADAYPALLISEASLEELNRRSPRQNTMAQFRPNLVVTDCELFAEDGWKKIKIGEVIFEVSKPCERCVMTTVRSDGAYNTFDEQQEPLATLAKFRANNDGGVFFGQNLKPLNEGTISVTDSIEVLETQKKAAYYNMSSNMYDNRPNQKEASQSSSASIKELTITLNGKQFTGNNQETLLSQAEAAGINLPFKCRAGTCGTCKSTLINGEVHQTESRALARHNASENKAENKILPCCCIPLSDIELSTP
ncbi:MAG: MOSC N-terminal beta barrel domain-containing protein [Cellvibrionaceae bacterium]